MKTKIYLLVLIILIVGCASLNQSQADQYYQQAINFSNQGNNTAALNAVTNAIEKNPNANYYLLRARLYSKLNKSDLAKADYQYLLGGTESNNLQLKAEYTNFLCDSGNYNTAIYFFSMLDNTSIKSTNPAKFYDNFANCLVKAGKDDNAIDIYTKALSYDNAPFSSYAGISSLYAKQRNFPVANYYAQLYSGPDTNDSLQMKIKALSNLIANSNYSDQDKLKSQLATLNSRYAQLAGSPASQAELNNNVAASQVAVKPNNNLINKPSIVNNNVAVNGPGSSVAKQAGSPANSDRMPPSFQMTNIKADNDTPATQSASVSNDTNTVHFSARSARLAAIEGRVRTDSKGRNYIIVAASDTVYSISQATKTSINTLTKLNNIVNNKIEVGQVLYLN